MIYTFWEGRMPAYIKLCLETWKVPFIVLDYNSLRQYTELDTERMKRFTLPQQADCVRVHVLRDNGGIWLDADTIMIADKLPDTEMVGNPKTRTNTIGFLQTEKESEMYKAWAEYQDRVIAKDHTPDHWAIMGNAFTDEYVRQHQDITIGDVQTKWAETYMIEGSMARAEKYREFYFKRTYSLSDLLQTDILMLHNSWTPQWYKNLTEHEVLAEKCTLSNILREVTKCQ